MKILNPLPLQYLKVERLRQKLLGAYDRQEALFPAPDLAVNPKEKDSFFLKRDSGK